jgi:PST family polysaccharide transporter
MGRFIPGFAIALVLDRARYMAERLLVRELRFRTVALVNSVGELTFTACALALAARGAGGFAIVFAGIARSIVTFIAFVAKAPRAEWLTPSKLDRATARDFFVYGIPVMIGALADRAASTWDNLLVLRMFGPRLMGCYALSYSLAETPLVYVAERMGDVLMPAFSKMAPEERPPAVIRAAGLMALVVAPLGVGIGAVAPTVVQIFFDARWSEMASVLGVLATVSVFQPAPWSAIAYLQAEKLTRLIMITSIARAAILLATVFTLGKLGGPVWACAGVGVGFVVHAVLVVVLTSRVRPIPAMPYLTSVAKPLLACVPMYLSVAFVRPALTNAHVPEVLCLLAQIACGAVVYVVGAFAFAGAIVRELIGILRGRAARGT